MSVSSDIPDEISRKLQDNEDEAELIIEAASKCITDFPIEEVALSYQTSAPTDVLTYEERAQSMVFMFRYDHLPEIDNLVVGEHRGRYFINEIDEIRAALNEYRTIFFNQRDAIYFGRISNVYRAKLINRDPSLGLSITAEKNNKNVTDEYVAHLDSRNKAIRAIIKESDFDYLFNAVLQHSEPSMSKRLIDDYTSGKMNYILLRNLTLARHIKHLFKGYYRVVSGLSFPWMGGL